ncbi:MAG: sortase [Patescibacteria group bacterium]|nr:sortase [Patescibacteria group bacterium]
MQTKQAFTIYDIEADEFKTPVQSLPLWKLLLEASGVFVVITFIVFFIANYQYIQSQLVDWRQVKTDGKDFVKDNDNDKMPDWWEQSYGLNTADSMDGMKDEDNDLMPNIMEFQFGTDPRNPDTDGDGYFDGEEYLNGYNPNGVGRIDTDKDGIHDWWEESNGLNKKDPADSLLDYDNDQLNNKEEYEYGTNPRNPDTDGDGYSDKQEINRGSNPIGRGFLNETSKNSGKDKDLDKLEIDYENLFGTDPENRDTDGDGFNDYHELTRGYDPSGSGMIDAVIEIPSIDVEAPIIWSQSEKEKEILNDLSDGVIHYPGSAFPGMRGNVYITGHSSFYSWSKSSWKEIFKDIERLENGDEVIFHLKLKNKKNIDIVYEICLSEIVQPDDVRLFRDYEGYELTLVTCWPIGTDLKRLMVKGVLK